MEKLWAAMSTDNTLGKPWEMFQCLQCVQNASANLPGNKKFDV